ncbi:hypothetical protein [Nocardia terpenica]|uniref:hypothetical protein n=1 Tax=Nocardia terpenica TaxID=455432 RepID=UPI001EEB5CA2|nr:hypothetical protein [Nocardia terpenica]
MSGFPLLEPEEAADSTAALFAEARRGSIWFWRVRCGQGGITRAARERVAPLGPSATAAITACPCTPIAASGRRE